jgi:hypothetical protein
MSLKKTAQEELPLRFVIYHLNPTSARLRFYKSNSGHICLPEPLPPLSDLIYDFVPTSELAVHPAAYVQAMCATDALNPNVLSIENDLRCWVDTPARVLPIFFLRVISESPFSAPEGFRWIELPDGLSLTETERLMMRYCYQGLME